MDSSCRTERDEQARNQLICMELVGGPEGIRTLDPLVANQVLSQLSYRPNAPHPTLLSLGEGLG